MNHLVARWWKNDSPARQRAIAAVLASALAALSPTPASSNDDSPPAGKLKGDFRVTANGEASYSIRILAPPGINKVHPTLSLSYNSSGGNGRLGAGWNLVGLSTITRCKATPVADGFRGTVSYGATDRYCLDNQRLINIAGANGAASSEYRTQLETWRRVQASAQTCGSGPCSFTVTTRDGTTASYGTTPDSAILSAGRADVRVWALKAVTDLNGNTITYSYTLDPLGSGNSADAQYYVARIDYTANAKAGVAANRSVRFTYAARPDLATRYVGGGAVTTRWRLATVGTYVQESLVHQYRLGYQPSAASGRSLLASVQICDGAGNGAACLPATAMGWSNAPPSFSQTTLNATFASANSQIIPADVNGDGRGDLLYVTRSQGNVIVQPYVSTGTDLVSCGTALQIPDNRQPFYTLDIDGSGKAALVRLANRGSGVLGLDWFQVGPDNCSYAASGQLTPSPSLQAIPDQVWPLDIDGDGRTDLVLGWWVQGQLSLVTLRSTGAGFENTGASTLSATSRDRIVPMDVNGDGMVDLVRVSSRQGNTVLDSYLSDGRTFAGSPKTTVLTAGDLANTLGLWPMDLNQDGNTSLVQGWRGDGGLNLTVLASDGTGGFVLGNTTRTGRAVANAKAFWPTDVMGSGQSDLVQVQSRQGKLAFVIYRFINQAFDTGTDTATEFLATDFDNVWAVDLAGSGRMGIMQGVSRQGTMSLRHSAVPGPASDLVGTFTDGLGGQVAVTYKPMSDPSVYTIGTSRHPQVAAGLYGYRKAPAQGPFQRVGGGTAHLVSGYVSGSPQAPGAAAYNYGFAFRYAGGLNDLSGHGWLGFASMTKTDLSTGLATVTGFNQAFPQTGTVASLVKSCDATYASDPRCPKDATATRLSASATSYANITTVSGVTAPNPPVVQVLKSGVRLETYVYGVFDYARGKSFSYDAYGNAILRTDLGYVDGGGNPLNAAAVVHTCTQYANDPANWAFGFASAIKVSSSVDCRNFGTFVPGTDFSLEALTYTTPSRNIASQSTWDDGNKAFLTTRYQQDAFGNLTSKTDPGNRTTTTTFEPVFNTYPLTRTSPPNAQGTQLTETFSFDPRSGVQVAYRDVSGNVKVTCTDTFGRITAQQGPLPGRGLPDTNCLAAGATGPQKDLAAAPVATLRTMSRATDGAKRSYIRVGERQNWGGSGDPVTWQWRIAYTDAIGRPYQKVVQDLPARGNVFSCATYNSANRVSGMAVPFFASGLFVECAEGNAGQLWSKTTYDVTGRRSTQSRPHGETGSPPAITTFAHGAGGTTTVTYAATQSYKFVKELKFAYFNAARRLTSMSLPGAGGAVTQFSYDPIGRLVGARDPPTAANPQGVLNSIAYDSLKRRRSIDNPDQNTTGDSRIAAMAYRYDPANGFLQTTTDALGQTVTSDRDGLGRVLHQQLSDGTRYTFTYDSPDAANGRGRLTGVAASRAGKPLYQHSYDYDPYGKRSRRTLTVGGATYSETRSFDPQSRLTQQTFPDQSVLAQTWVMNHLAGQTLDGAAVATYPDYSPLGQVLSVTYGNATRSKFTYYPTGETHEWSVLAPNGSTLLDLSVHWDQLKQVASITDKLKTPDDLSQTFTTTNTRLTAASAPSLYGSLTFNYDASGNLCVGGATCTFAAHRLTGMTAGGKNVALVYDAKGNLKSKTSGADAWSFHYDVLSRLTSVQQNDVVAFSVPVYDFRGRRLLTEAGDVTTAHVTENYRVSTDSAGTSTTTKYINSPRGTIASIATLRSSHGTTVTPLYLHQDQVASTTLMTDASGTPAARFGYLPFGGTAKSSGPATVDRQFQDRPHDAATGLYDFGARYFDPSIGRFLTPDSRLAASHTTPDAINRFAFALNNPPTYVDALGHNIWDQIGGALIGALEVAVGVALDVLTDGALEPVGQVLIGAGMGGFQYAVTSGSNFSWKQYGIQTGIGAATGLIPGGGEEAEAGAAAADEGAEEGASVAAEDSVESNVADDGAPAERLDSSTRAEESPASARNEAPDEEARADDSDRQNDEDQEQCEASNGNFVPGTIIVTELGPKPIEQLRRRDRVLGFDARTGRPRIVSVASVSRHATPLTARITTNGATITAGEQQRLLVEGRGWVAASALEPGDRLRTVSGASREVERVDITNEPAELVGIEVADLHTFAASDDGVVAHNLPCRRLRAVGRTPGKYSRTGQEVWDRMANEQPPRARLNPTSGQPEVFVETSPGNSEWRAFDRNIHMGHLDDAVDWWNREGYQYGPRSQQARDFMLNSDNYEFEWGPLNSSNGARLGQTYRRPLGWGWYWPW